MRRYLQGTLDYTCAIYAVINALSLLYKIDLSQGRHLFQQTILEVAKHPTAWHAFMHNQTDQYWLIRYMLERWCTAPPFKLTIEQPFATCLCPRQEAAGKKQLEPTIAPYIGEEDCFHSQGSFAYDPTYAAELWETLKTSLAPRLLKHKTVALVRFHRFIPKHQLPFVSHWTTLSCYEQNAVHMHDASAEENSIFSIAQQDTLPPVGSVPPVVLVPASLVLLERQ